MRTATDALRSLNRYVAQALGDDWEVRITTEKGTFTRPMARVIQVPSLVFVVESQFVTSLQSAYQVVCFPRPGDSPDESQLIALDVVEALWQAFGGPGITTGHIARVPLYDYAGVPVSGPAAFVTEDRRRVNDFMWVMGTPDVLPYPDADNESLWSVVLNIRMSWTRSAAVPSPGTQAVSINPAAQVEGT